MSGMPERGAYTLRARLLEQGQVLSESKYNFAYGSNSASRLLVDDLVPNSEGITVVLSPNQASLFDIEYMLVDGHDVVYETKTEKASSPVFRKPFPHPGVLSLKIIGSIRKSKGSGLFPRTRDLLLQQSISLPETMQRLLISIKMRPEQVQLFYGRSQVPFEGSLVFSVYEVQETSGSGSSNLWNPSAREFRCC